jgi:hypothetical protein
VFEIGYTRAPSIDITPQFVSLGFEIRNKAEHLVSRFWITQRAVGSCERDRTGLGTRGKRAFEFGNACDESGLGLVQKVLLIGEGTAPFGF